MNIFEWFKMIDNMDLTVFEKIGDWASIAAGIIFCVLYSYQFFYLILAWFRKPLTYPETDKTKKYAVLIAARNEENVLPGLLNSLSMQITAPTTPLPWHVRTAPLWWSEKISSWSARAMRCRPF